MLLHNLTRDKNYEKPDLCLLVNPLISPGRDRRMTRVSTGRPPWRQALDKAGRPLEGITTSPAYVNLLAVGVMARRAAAGAATRLASGLLAPARRAANVPTRDDVLRLSRQLEVLTTEVRALAAAQRASRPAARSSGRPPVSEPPRSRRPPG
jgi:hypothetical protein